MQTAIPDPKGTYEQGTGAQFDYDRFFDANKNWFQVLTNSRPKTSIVKRVLNRPSTCENTMIHYEKDAGGIITYTNFCYLHGKRNPGLDRSGRLVQQAVGTPFFHMKDAKTGKEAPFNIAVTDYDNFAIITDRQQYFWVLSRKTSICSNAYTYITQKLVAKNYNVSNITGDMRAIVNCSSEPVPEEGAAEESTKP